MFRRVRMPWKMSYFSGKTIDRSAAEPLFRYFLERDGFSASANPFPFLLDSRYLVQLSQCLAKRSAIYHLHNTWKVNNEHSAVWTYYVDFYRLIKTSWIWLISLKIWSSKEKQLNFWRSNWKLFLHLLWENISWR